MTGTVGMKNQMVGGPEHLQKLCGEFTLLFRTCVSQIVAYQLILSPFS